jgi:phosphoglycerate kinase
MIKSIGKIKDLKGKRVLLRVDFNLPIKEIEDGSDWRIKSAIPTLEYLSKNGSKIIIISHLGRPKGRDMGFSLYPVFLKLKKIWRKDGLFFAPDVFGKDTENKIKKLKEGEAILIENIRFYKEEEENSEDFAKKISKYGDIFVNDAFSASHRSHSSIVGIPKFLESYAGLLMKKEISVLSAVRDKPRRPFVLVMGGAKVETKLKLVRHFLNKSEAIILGGVLANTLFKAKNIAIGKSIIDENLIDEAGKFKIISSNLHLPVDVLVSKSLVTANNLKICPVGNIGDDEFITDIGPESAKLFNKIIKTARMVVWNGAFGLTEVSAFKKGSLAIAESISKINGEKIVGGGDLVNFLSEENFIDKMSYVSTGGGAMLEFLAGDNLPGIESLLKSK